MSKTARKIRRTKTPSQPAVSAKAPIGRVVNWPLLAVFLFTLAVHFQQLKDAYQYPIFATDAVQYVGTAESLSQGRGYQLRGNFNTSLPPLYPVFLAVGHLMPGDPRTTVFFLSILVMATMVFPAFGLARRLGFPTDVSLVLASAAGFLPHTVYAATSMAETLHIPLVMFAVVAIWDWFEDPSLCRSAETGIWLNLLLLNKVAGWQMVVPFVLVASPFLLRISKSRLWMLRRFGLALGVPLGTMLLWSGYKQLAHGSAIGTYGAALSQGLPELSARIVALYAADYAAAGGLVLLIPVVYWVWHCGAGRAVTVFLILWFAMQVLWTGVVDGGLTGMLRERLFCVSLPVFLMVGIRGLQVMIHARSLKWVVASALGGFAICAGLVAGERYIAPAAIESPWLHAASALASQTGLRFPLRPAALFVAAAGVLVPLFLWTIREPWRIRALAGLLLLAQGSQFLYMSHTARAMREQGLQVMSEGLGLFKSLGIGRGAKVIAIVTPSAFDLNARTRWNDLPAAACAASAISDHIHLMHYESLLLWDVRIACTDQELNRFALTSDFIISKSEVEGARRIGTFTVFGVYRIPKKPA